MSPIKRRLIITLATLMLVAMVPAAVMAAGGTFTDDDDSLFESHIEWLADAGVTAGCNPPTNDHFCPTDNVTRGQMAAFMKRFAEFLGAEDGIVSEADHAATADSATSADSADTATLADTATNAGTVDGKNAIEFQPSTNAFDTDDLTVPGNGNYAFLSAGVSTADHSGFLCFIGTVQTADIRVHASGAVSGLTAGETASFRLKDSNGTIVGTNRYVSDNFGSFAIDWLYELVPGGTETFELEAYEGGSDAYNVVDATLLVEVLSDTRCKGTPIIIFPNPPAVADPEVAGS